MDDEVLLVDTAAPCRSCGRVEGAHVGARGARDELIDSLRQIRAHAIRRAHDRSYPEATRLHCEGVAHGIAAALDALDAHTRGWSGDQ